MAGTSPISSAQSAGPETGQHASNTRKPPFFILGCVRSGTTLLRDVIASHPLLFCPNETHFYRFADPYGTMSYVRPILNQKLFQHHRSLDGITEEQFRDDILLKSKSRRELIQTYGEAYLKANGAPKDARWFDKTPQHVYGALLIAHQFPDAKFVHIVRNPLNVIASLRTSKVMTVKEIIGAANYWQEAAIIMKALQKLLGDRLLELTYEDFTTDPKQVIERVFRHIDEDPDAITYNLKKIRPEKNKYQSCVSQEDIATARDICGDLAVEYGYQI